MSLFQFNKVNSLPFVFCNLCQQFLSLYQQRAMSYKKQINKSIISLTNKFLVFKFPWLFSRLFLVVFSRCGTFDMKYIFRLGSNLLIVIYTIPASCSKSLILKNLRLGDAPSQTHALTLNPTHSKILIDSHTNGNSWSAVKEVHAWCPNVAHNRLHILLTMNTLRMWQFFLIYLKYLLLDCNTEQKIHLSPHLNHPLLYIL